MDPIPAHLLANVERAITRAFTEAISACDASSSLDRIDSIRRQLSDAVDVALAAPLRLHNARLSLQNRLPVEVWLDVWAWLPLAARIAVSHVCSRWRELSVDCPDLWTAIECISHGPRGDFGDGAASSSLGLVTMALARTKGRPLSLTVSLYPSNTYLPVVDEFVTVLRPHAHEIADINGHCCSVQQLQLILGRLQPLSSLRRLVHATDPTENAVPAPLFPQPLFCPVLQSVVLLTEQPYYWSWYPTDFDGSVPVMRLGEVPFPALKELCFTPAHAADIAQALHDCPTIASLSLSLSHLEWGSGQFDAFDFSLSHLTDLRLYGVPLEHLHEALGFYRALATRQCFSVMFAGLPRSASGLPQTPSHWAVDSQIPQWSSPTYEDRPGPSGIPPAVAPAHDAPFQSFGDIFRDLDGPVAIDLSVAVDGMRPSETKIVLRATDAAGLTRIAGLCQSDGDGVILACHAHVWRVVRPRHLACDVECFPLLAAALWADSPARSIELRFTHFSRGERVSFAIPAPQPGPRFPHVRALRLNPRFADPASQTVLNADEIAYFVRGLGAALPLDAITICSGVVVQDAAGVLEALAGAVFVDADPGPERLHDSCYPYAQMGLFPAVSNGERQE